MDTHTWEYCLKSQKLEHFKVPLKMKSLKGNWDNLTSAQLINLHIQVTQILCGNCFPIKINEQGEFGFLSTKKTRHFCNFAWLLHCSFHLTKLALFAREYIFHKAWSKQGIISILLLSLLGGMTGSTFGFFPKIKSAEMAGLMKRFVGISQEIGCGMQTFLWLAVFHFPKPLLAFPNKEPLCSPQSVMYNINA